MTRDELLETIIAFYRSYAPSVDTSEGSRWRTEFADRLVDMLAVPLDVTDVSMLISDRMARELPELGVDDPGSPAAVYLRKAGHVLLEPIRQSLVFYRRRRAGLANPSMLSLDAADELAGTFFTSLVRAGRAVVTVRLRFAAPTSFVISLDNVARAPNGRTFIPMFVTEVTAESMKDNVENGLYYVDVDFVAENEGSVYEVNAGEIYTVERVPGLVSATNPQPSTHVSDGQTPEEMVNHIVSSLGERSLVTVRGISALVRNAVPDISDVFVVGHGDAEMDRDVLTASLKDIPFKFKATEAVLSGPFVDPQPVFAESVLSAFPYTNRTKLIVDYAQGGGPGTTYFADAQVGDLLTTGDTDRRIVSKIGYVYETDDCTFVFGGRVKTDEVFDPTNGIGAPLEKTPVVRTYDGSEFDSVLFGDFMFAYVDASWNTEPSRVVQNVDGDGVYVDSGFSIIGFGGSCEVVGTDAIVVEGVYAPVWPEFGSIRLTLYNSEMTSPKGYEVESIVSGESPGTTKIIVVGELGQLPQGNLKWTLWACNDYNNLAPLGIGLPPGPSVYCVILRCAAHLSLDRLFVLGDQQHAWSCRRPVEPDENSFVIEVSDIPGGVSSPIPVPSNQVHIGGKVDVYVFPNTEFSTERVTISPARDIDPLLVGRDVEWVAGSNIMSSADIRVVDGIELASACVTVKNGMSITAYRVMDIKSGAVTVDEQFDTDGSSEKFELHSPYLAFDLKDGRAVRARGNDLVTYLASREVTTSEYLGDVLPGDTLRILSSDQNRGDYVISDVLNGRLRLASAPPKAASGMAFEVFTPTASPTLPVTRLLSVTIGDGMGGMVRVPHGRPVGIVVVRDMQNAGGDKKYPNGPVRVVRCGIYLNGSDVILEAPEFVVDLYPSVAEGDLVTLLEPSKNAGTYRILDIEPAVGGRVKMMIDIPNFDGGETEVDCGFSGNRVVGTARAYFYDPTLFHVPSTVAFMSGERRYYCKSTATLFSQSLREPASIVSIGGEKVIRARSGWAYANMLVGKYLSVTTRAFRASIAGGAAYVVGRALKVRVGDGPVQTVVFRGNNPLPLSASGTPGGIVEQIKAGIRGVDVWADGDTLYIASTDRFVVHPSTAAPMLGFVSTPWHNTSANANVFVINVIERDGDYTLFRVAPLGGGAGPNEENDVYFDVFDSGVVAFPASMSYDEDLSLYYTDFELVSDTSGDVYELSRGDVLKLERDPIFYGWHLATENTALTFSVVEELKLKLSAVFYDSTARDVTGQSFVGASEVVYIESEYNQVVPTAHTFATRTDARVVSADVLVKSARPAWVTGTVRYYGGEPADVILPSSRAQIRSIGFGQTIDVSLLRNVFIRYGALDFDEPTRLAVVMVEKDRSFALHMISDRFRAPDTFHFLPDQTRYRALGG